MTELLLVGAGVLIFSIGLWATIKMARAVGEANAVRDQARADLEAQKKAGEVIAEHRTPDDAAGRLRDNSF